MDNVTQKSILDAIQQGVWDFEPQELSAAHYSSTAALPGSIEKLEVLAARARKGLPLWHDEDRRSYDDVPETY